MDFLNPISDIYGIGSGIYSLFNRPKEDPEIAKNRTIARNMAAMAATGVNPSATTDVINTAKSGIQSSARQNTQSYLDQLRRTGSLTPGTFARGAAEIQKGAGENIGNVISQYKGQAALQAPERALGAANVVSGLPGYIPSGQQLQRQNQISGFGAGLSGLGTMGMFREQNQNINDLIKAYKDNLYGGKSTGLPTGLPLAFKPQTPQAPPWMNEGGLPPEAMMALNPYGF